MNWRWECQTCAKAKRDYGWGVVFPCNEDKCEPEAIKNTATTSSIPTKQYQSNKTVEEQKMKPETLAELLEQVAEKVEKDVAQVCITIVKQYENGNEIARDIAEKYGIDLEGAE